MSEPSEPVSARALLLPVRQFRVFGCISLRGDLADLSRLDVLGELAGLAHNFSLIGRIQYWDLIVNRFASVAA